MTKLQKAIKERIKERLREWVKEWEMTLNRHPEILLNANMQYIFRASRPYEETIADTLTLIVTPTTLSNLNLKTIKGRWSIIVSPEGVTFLKLPFSDPIRSTLTLDRFAHELAQTLNLPLIDHFLTTLTQIKPSPTCKTKAVGQPIKLKGKP